MSTLHQTMPESLRNAAPWIGAAAAALLAALFLSMFIDMLHLSIERGHALRKAQSAPAVIEAPTSGVRMASTDNSRH